MRYIVIFCLFSLIYSVTGRNGKAGPEPIEISDPIKELPPGLEEEPSGELTDDDKFGNTIQPATKETRRTSTIDTRRKSNEKIEEDEETKIEKQLAELYRDAPDYKADSSEKDVSDKPKQTKKSEVSEIAETEDIEDKPIRRQGSRSEFKFQPDVTNKAAIEKFRTSVDTINCDKRVTQKHSDAKKSDSNMATKQENGFIYVVATVLTILYC